MRMMLARGRSVGSHGSLPAGHLITLCPAFHPIRQPQYAVIPQPGPQVPGIAALRGRDKLYPDLTPRPVSPL
jgi:hypothetical protein